jgi:hypothetical protein
MARLEWSTVGRAWLPSVPGKNISSIQMDCSNMMVMVMMMVSYVMMVHYVMLHYMMIWYR